jgi:VWFA-related protein
MLATDSSGQPIGRLNQSDITATSGGQTIPIDVIASAPVSVVIIVDASGSMRSKLGGDNATVIRSRKSLSDLIGKLNRCDELAVLAFGSFALNGAQEIFTQQGNLHFAGIGAPPAQSDVALLQPFTTDHGLALSKLTSQVAFGETPLYDSIHAGVQVLARAHYLYRFIVVITDGLDNNSMMSKEAVLAEAKRADVAVYFIGLGDPKAPRNADDMGASDNAEGGGTSKPSEAVDAATLRDFSSATGGQTFFGSGIEQDDSASMLKPSPKSSRLLTVVT